jgi:hypothetical protein
MGAAMRFVLCWMAAAALPGTPDGGAALPAAARPLYYQRAVTDADLAGRPLEELALMRNTIYARAGRRFKTPALRDYFVRQPWYHPSSTPAKLSGVDAANVRSISARERMLALQPLEVACPVPGMDGVVRDPARAAQLSALARKLKWQDDYGPPRECQREVRLTCGPDLDGDGEPESIVRVGWHALLNGSTCDDKSHEYWRTAKLFLVTGRPGSFRALAPLAIDIDGDQQAMRSSAYFVRLRDGRSGVRTETLNEAADTGCDLGEYNVYALEHGKLRGLENGDDSPPCDEQ